MANALSVDLQRAGFLARTADLANLGHSTASLRRALQRGELVRVCNGWVATAQADRDAVLAVASSGKLTSSSALSSRGTWDGCDSRIHVAVARNSPRTTRRLVAPLSLFVPPRHAREDLVGHWVRERAPDPMEPGWRVSVIDALAQSARHLPSDQFVACVDSALNAHTLSRAGLPRLETALGQKSRELLRLVDGSAESGLESLARVRLSRWVRRVQPQFAIPGISAGSGTGRVDLLLDGWLAIELDGDEWHDPKRDRRRDGILVRQGYRSHRFGFDQVVFDWDATAATVAELLRYPPSRA